jgi:hypothetical protein
MQHAYAWVQSSMFPFFPRRAYRAGCDWAFYKCQHLGVQPLNFKAIITHIKYLISKVCSSVRTRDFILLMNIWFARLVRNVLPVYAPTVTLPYLTISS